MNKDYIYNSNHYEAPTTEPERQNYFMDIAKKYVQEESERLGRPLFYKTTTFGCARVSGY